MFATHPPLRQRITRVDKNWDGQYIERQVNADGNEPSRPGYSQVGVGRAALVAAAMAGALTPEHSEEAASQDANFDTDPDQLEQDTARREDIPVALVQHSHEPLGAHALVYSLLISNDEVERQKQLGIISKAGVTGLDHLVFTISPDVQALGAPRRLPLLEMCLPALKSMSAGQYRLFKNTLLALIHSDQHIELHEWCLFQLVRHYLDPEFVRVKPSRARYRHLQKVAHHVRVVLSVLAHEGSGETDTVFRLGAEELGFKDMLIMPREQASVAAFSRAVHELADCYPLLKPRLLKAMHLAASAKGELSPVEREIVASMAAVMDCPVPSLPGSRTEPAGRAST